MTDRSVHITVEEGGTGRVLADSTDLNIRSQVAISPNSLRDSTPATVQFHDVGDMYAFVIFKTSNGNVPALVTSDSVKNQNINITFEGMLKIDVRNVLSEDELDSICSEREIGELFEKKGLHREIREDGGKN